MSAVDSVAPPPKPPQRNTPVVDPKTGRVEPAWGNFFTAQYEWLNTLLQALKDDL